MTPDIEINAGSEMLKDLMNKGIAAEIQASVQYMWQHVQWGGIKHFAVTEEIRSIAIQEMKHAEMIAERLWYLGGRPTIKPAPIEVGENLWEMVTNDIKAEEQAIVLYKEIIRLAKAEGDITTKFLFEKILEEEEEHHDFFSSVAEDNEMKS